MLHTPSYTWYTNTECGLSTVTCELLAVNVITVSAASGDARVQGFVACLFKVNSKDCSCAHEFSRTDGYVVVILLVSTGLEQSEECFEDVDAPALLDKSAVVFQPLGERERSLEPPLGVRDPRRARGNVGWYRVPYKIELN